MYKKAGVVLALMLAVSPFLVSAQTIAEVKAQIQSLRTQLAQLETLLAQLEADPSAEQLNGTWTLGTWSAVAGTTSLQSGGITFIENTANASHGIQQYINVPEASIWEFSFEANPVGARGALIYLMDALNQSAAYVATQCEFTGAGRISAKWAGPNTGSSSSISRLADGWYKCTARARLYATSTASQLRIVVYTEKNATSAYQGDGTSGLQFRNIVLGGKFVGPPPVKATLSSDFVQSLFALREGYGANTTGGLGGDVYVVTNLNDSGPGSLRFAAEDTIGKPTWITFAQAVRGGTITLASPIRIGANKTIDGRGSGMTIVNRGLDVGANNGSSNVIVSDIAVRNVTDKEQDNISIYGAGVKNVWIHRVSLSGQGSDGLLDISSGATDITIDSSRFTDHDAVMIINSYPSAAGENPLAYYDRDKEARVTLHHNVFLGTTQRHPRAVFGKVHMYNNVLKEWGSYGIGSSFRAQTLVEGNTFESSGPYGTSALLARVGADPESGFIRARDNLFVGNAAGSSSGAESVFTPPYQYRCELATSALHARLIQSAGVEGSDSVSAVPFASACPQIPLPPPTCTLTSNKASYAHGESMVFTWTSTHANAATFMPAAAGQIATPTGTLAAAGTQSIAASVAGSSTITLKVTSSTGATATCSATVSVAAAPPPVTWQSLNGNLIAWTVSNASISNSGGVVTLVENTGTQAHRIEQYISVPSTSGIVRFTFEISPVGTRGVRAYVLDTDRQSTNYIASNFVLSGAGSFSKWKGPSTTNNDTTITNLGDGWYRVTMSGSINPSAVSKLRIILGSEVNGSESYQGNGSSGFMIRNVALDRQVVGAASSNADSTNLANSLSALQSALQALSALFAR